MRRDPWRPRLTAPLALLVVGLGCVAFAVWEVQRSIRSNTAVVERELTGYATFAAWSYTEHLSVALRQSAQEILAPVNMLHTSRTIPRAHNLGDLIRWDPRCPCHIPRYGPIPSYLYQFRLGSDQLDVAPNQAPAGTEGWLSDPVGAGGPIRQLPRATQRWVLDTLTRVARLLRSPFGYQLLIQRGRDSTNYFALTRMPTTWGDTIVYAVQYPSSILSGVLEDVLDDRGLLPPVLTRYGNRAVLSVQVRDADGGDLFGSNVPDAWRLDATAQIAPALGGPSVRVMIQPLLANQIVIGGTPRSHLPQLIGLLILAAGLTIIAVIQLRREARFARERAAFVANVSHELRTPLSQIRLVVDTLRLGREPEAARREAAMGLIDREATRLQHLSDRVLRFTRGERADDSSPLVPTDPVAEATRVVEEFAPLAHQRRVRLALETREAPAVTLDPGALRQVLLNLLDNAVKYGPEGQTVTLAVSATPEGGARFTVTDQGPGVPAAERERIWRPFERGHAAGARAAGGSGIGLTVVHEIAERHGGSVGVGEAAGGGATFHVDFPPAR
ncbi:MAG TPA: HAMP domain-containing sensor histidine kinase [Gemmatimonadales bacterium]|nr:HAMP domain-containing sensor histidine kinase [Gemmatimonadales bacterium]